MKFQYRQVSEGGREKFVDALNEAGSEGWEAFHVESVNGFHIALMKRAVEEPAAEPPAAEVQEG